MCVINQISEVERQVKVMKISERAATVKVQQGFWNSDAVGVNEKTNTNTGRAGNWSPVRPVRPQSDAQMSL